MAARRPVRVAFFTPPFWRNLCLILREWANTRPACREYARRSKDGFEHPEFSILKAPIKKILGVHHVRNAFSCFRSPPDAASLAALLQSAAQALLRSGTPSDEEHPAPAKVERIQEEIRHYRFPPWLCAAKRTVGSGKRRRKCGNCRSERLSLETLDLLELMNPEAKVEGGDAYAGPGIAAYRQIGVQDPRRLQHRGACESIARPRQIINTNGRTRLLAINRQGPFSNIPGKQVNPHPYRRRGDAFPTPGTDSFWAALPTSQSLGKGGGPRGGNPSSRFPFPGTSLFSPNYLSAGTGWSKPSSGRKGSSSMTVG